MKKTSIKLLCLMSLCNVHGGAVEDLLSLLPRDSTMMGNVLLEIIVPNIKEKRADLIDTLRKGEAALLAQPAREKEMQNMQQKLEQLTKKDVKSTEQLQTLQTERDALMQALEAIGTEKNRNNLESEERAKMLESTQAAREEEMRIAVLAMQGQLNRLTGKEDDLKALQARFQESQEELETLKTERDALMQALEALGVENKINKSELEEQVKILKSLQVSREEEMQSTISAMQEQLKQFKGMNTLQTHNQDLEEKLSISEAKRAALMQAFKAIRPGKSSKKSFASSSKSIAPSIDELVPPTPPQDLSPAAQCPRLS